MASRETLNRPGFSSPLFSEAVIHNGLVHCSGKLGVNPKTGKVVSDDVGEQTTACLRLLESVLHTAGSDLTKMVKCNVYLTDMKDITAMNAAYVAMVPDPKPARLCVGISELGRGAKVEIDCVAVLDKARPSKL